MAADGLRGGCFCTAVRYRVEGPARDNYHCHCEACRRTHGAAFATFSCWERARFALIRGEADLAFYESPPGRARHFCRICAGSLFDREAARAGEVLVATGSLDSGADPGGRARLRHLKAAAKLPWLELADGLPREDGPLTAPEPIAPGRFPLFGGCDCGAVRYRIEAPVRETYHCHCEMCRKLHGALFGTFSNLPRESIAILRGRDALGTIDSSPPNHRKFCRVCGCPLFGDDERDPAYFWFSTATLDGGADPGHGARLRHIFVAHKVPWYDIADGLAQADDF